jgi:hypothetical protein
MSSYVHQKLWTACVQNHALVVSSISTTRRSERGPQGLRGSIPPSFPYFALERGLAAGHVHVIDDEADFPRGFGRGILVGLLGLPPEAAHQTLRAPGRAGPTGAQAAEFRKQFQPFDWTAQLE